MARRKYSDEDIVYYQRIIIALNDTIKITAKSSKPTAAGQKLSKQALTFPP